MGILQVMFVAVVYYFGYSPFMEEMAKPLSVNHLVLVIAFLLCTALLYPFFVYCWRRVSK